MAEKRGELGFGSWLAGGSSGAAITSAAGDNAAETTQRGGCIPSGKTLLRAWWHHLDDRAGATLMIHTIRTASLTVTLRGKPEPKPLEAAEKLYYRVPSTKCHAACDHAQIFIILWAATATF